MIGIGQDVVSIQGRMLTVLDLVTLLDSRAASGDASRQRIIALRGDEQLGLAIEELCEKIDVGDGVADGPPEGDELVLGVFNRDDVPVSILNVKVLFLNAIHGRERRRRRF